MLVSGLDGRTRPLAAAFPLPHTLPTFICPGLRPASFSRHPPGPHWAPHSPGASGWPPETPLPPCFPALLPAVVSTPWAWGSPRGPSHKRHMSQDPAHCPLPECIPWNMLKWQRLKAVRQESEAQCCPPDTHSGEGLWQALVPSCKAQVLEPSSQGLTGDFGGRI